MSSQEKMKALILELVTASDTEEDNARLSQEISHISPDPAWLTYVFHSSEYYNDDETLDVDAVVEKAFAYRPIVL